MSIEALMNQSVTLRTQSGFDRDLIGGAEPTYEEISTLMYLEPTAGQEAQPDRQTPIGDWLGIGSASLPWDSTQEIIYGSHRLSLISPPRPFRSGLSGAEHHVEMDLQEIG